jgi:hypothetical protein
MDPLLVVELVVLALSDPDDPESRVEKMFDWYLSRQLEIAKWSLAAASSIAVALLPLLFDHTKTFSVSTVALALLAIALSGGVALVKFASMARRASLYVSAIHIIRSVQVN